MMARTKDKITFYLYPYFGKEISRTQFQLSLDELTIENLMRKIGEELKPVSVEDLYCNHSIFYINDDGESVRLNTSTEYDFRKSFVEFVCETMRRRREFVHLVVSKQPSREKKATGGNAKTESVDMPGEQNVVDVVAVAPATVSVEKELPPSSVSGEKLLLLTDFTNLFNCQLNTDSKMIVNQLECSVTCVFTDFQRTKKMESEESREAERTGILSVKRVPADRVADLLRCETKVLVPTDKNEYLLMEFTKNHRITVPSFLHWQKQERSGHYECEEVKIPVKVGEETIAYECLDAAKLIKSFDSLLGSSCTSRTGSSELSAAVGTAATAARNSLETKRSSCPAHTKNVYDRQTRDIVGIEEPPAWFDSRLNEFKDQLVHDLERMTTVVPSSSETMKCAPNAQIRGEVCSKKPPSSTNENSQERSDVSLLENLVTRLSVIEEHVYSLEDVIKPMETIVKKFKTSHVIGSSPDTDNERRTRDVNASFARKSSSVNAWRKGENGKMIQVGADLYVLSKSGFKIKMPPNCSHSLRLVLVKHGKYRSSNEELELVPESIPYGVECYCYLKAVAKSNEKSPVPDKPFFSYHDVRIKTKDKHGRFQCFFSVVQNEKICGQPIRLDVRVKKFYPNPESADCFPVEETEPFLESRPCKRKTRCGGKSASSTLLKRQEESTEVQASSSCDIPDFLDSADTDDESETKVLVENDVGKGKIGSASPSAFHRMQNEDSDSSVSLLLDEYENRRKMTADNLDVVQLPRCFVVDSTATNIASQDSVPIRVKRKTSKSPLLNAPETGNVRFSVTTTDEPEILENAILSPITEWAVSSPKQSEDAGCSAGTSGVVSNSAQPSYRCWYPSSKSNPDGANEFANLVGSGREKNEHIPSSLEDTNVNSSTGKDAQPVVILPEKVFEMTSNVFKSVLGTIKPQAEGVKDNFQKTFDALISQSVASCTSASLSPPAVQTWTTSVTKSTAPGTRTASSSSADAATCSDFLAPAQSSPSSSPPPPPPPLSASSVRESDTGVEAGVPSSTARDSYEDLPAHTKRQLLRLNEMGFINDNYNLFLLSQYPNNMDKVVESLINYIDAA